MRQIISNGSNWGCAQERMEIKWNEEKKKKKRKSATTNRCMAIDRHVVKCNALRPTLVFNKCVNSSESTINAAMMLFWKQKWPFHKLVHFCIFDSVSCHILWIYLCFFSSDKINWKALTLNNHNENSTAKNDATSTMTVSDIFAWDIINKVLRIRACARGAQKARHTIAKVKKTTRKRE